jgi:membrane protein
MAGLLARIEALKERGRGLLERRRIRWPWFDHLIRTVHRYQVQSGDRLAGGVTYFAFLSFFPLVALAFALFGYVVSIDSNALTTLEKAIDAQLPGLAARLDLSTIAESRVGAGLIGLLGLLYAGLGAVDALRVALREIWLTTEPEPSFFAAKLRDLAALVLIGGTLIISVVVSGFATGATGIVAGWLGVAGSVPAEWLLLLVGLAVGLGADVLVFLVILGWLVKSDKPFPVVLRGALLGAVGLGVLKQAATLLLSITLHNAIYGAFTVIVSLLIWINLSARVVFLAAAWTATAAMGPPPEPTPPPSTTAVPA